MRALLVVLALSLSVSYFAQSKPPTPSSGIDVHQKDGKPEQAQQQSANIERGTLNSPIFVHGIPADVSDADARHKAYEHHEKPSLDRWLTYSTVALAFFTLGLAIYTARLFRATVGLSRDAKSASANQAKEAAASLAVAQRTIDVAISAQRPWLAIDRPLPRTPFRWHPEGGRITAEITVRNVGQRPAFGVSVEVHQFTMSKETANVEAQLQKHCAQVRARQLARNKSGGVIFPNQSTLSGHLLLFTTDEINRSMAEIKIRFFNPIVLVCADYFDALTNERHMTATVYFVVKGSQGVDSYPSLLSPDHGEIAVSEIGLPPFDTESLAT